MNADYSKLKAVMTENQDQEGILEKIGIVLNYFDIWESSLQQREKNLIGNHKEQIPNIYEQTPNICNHKEQTSNICNHKEQIP
jgi:hypothetical protein